MATVYLDAVLEPPRSLSPRGFNRVMMILGGMSFLSSLLFLSIGAWPVMGVMGLEIFALWWVFRYSFRAQLARTYVRVTADAIDVRKVDGWGRERRASFASHAAPASPRISPAWSSTAPPMAPTPCASRRHSALMSSANSSPRANARLSLAASHRLSATRAVSAIPESCNER
ncbi:MAG: DUF2244 domain-containing protein [Alphaproteobacteria bacterium]|nr:MAG: DUF2244 domain-containing protein [Alphaproteobacteria bacterium]